MVELDKIRSDIKDLIADIESAFRKLERRGNEYQEEQDKIDARKTELLLLDQRKVNAIQSVKDEELAAAEKKKEHTEKKLKYRRLIAEEEENLSVHRGRVQKEVDSYRIKEMSSVKSERDKVVSETVIAKEELAKMRAEYAQTKRDIDNLINRIR